MPLPFLLVGDHPQLPSGLGRILRDLAQRLADDPALDLDVRVLGCRPSGNGPDGMPWIEGPHIPVWSFTASEDLGESIAQHAQWAWQRWWGQQDGVLLSIWDAARIHALTHAEGPWTHWAYVPVDGAMPGRRWVGPAADAVQRVARVLAYGRYGAEVLRTVRGEAVPYLPHGLDKGWFTTEPQAHLLKHNLSAALAGGVVPVQQSAAERRSWLGIVMTNQPRKDWGLAVATLAELRARGHKVKLWAHTDRAVGSAWSLPQLLDVHGLSRKTLSLTLSGESWTDDELRQAYQRCGVTLLPTLGEGFGYPLVESLASGVPVVHSTEAGGAELLPRPEWRVPKRGERIEGAHAIVRPVFDPADWANAVERVWAWQDGWADQGRGYCQGSVAHLGWATLWPRWRSWVRQGLQELDA